MSSDNFSVRESRCWRIAQFKNNFGDLQQIDVDTLECTLHDPLLHSPELALRVACKSPLRHRSSPSPTQSLAFTNVMGNVSPLLSGGRSPLRCSSTRSRDSVNEFSRPSTPLSATSFEPDLRPFCDCLFRFARTPDVVCDCGEPSSGEQQSPLWQWEAGEGCDAVCIGSNGRQVQFHQGRSVGTAAVRGSTPLSTDQQHFWELKLTSPLFGTDVMIGLGTDQVNLLKHKDRFASLLGEDNESWGLSYSGVFHHGGETFPYAAGFTRGCIVGVHLDTWHGQLSFYLNRKSLGIACKSTSFKERQLYPMISSTAARSSFRLVRTRSCLTSLQYLVCRRLRQLVPLHLHVLDALQRMLPPGLSVQLREKADWLLEPQPTLSSSSSSSSFVSSHSNGQQSPFSSSGSRSPDLHLPAFKRRRLM